ncbi:RecQ family ATP-dependent DNA helicase [Gordonia sp. CPCC 205333]|uniref:RecQ family ATP-dependent DNA helicase n=1 Tax=Gordonia sp. CPCC 205333 TaxID=3140790 RepID=UPI003AF3FDBE
MTPDAPTALQPAQQQVADRVITALAGPRATFRSDQLRAVSALLAPAARVLVVQATGWGKSAVYWAATAIRRSGGAGPTLIVSPLLSLMRDQVAAAERAGLLAATLNSANVDDWSAIEEQLRNGDLDVLLVSPERLANPGFGRRVLQALAGNLGLLVIDEAHAISDWGHDFRPDYRRVSDVLTTLNPETPVLATTATANARVTEDVAVQLGDDTLVLRGPLARKSLHLNVINGLSPIQRYGWIAQSLPELPGSGIVYALTVADTDRLVAAIKAVHGNDYPVAAYSGQLDPTTRHRLEDALLHNEIKALVATSALGMGYDKPDLGFVVHVGSPPSPVSYYQQVGRAGRAIDESVVALLASPIDDAIWEYFATATIPNPNHMETLLTTLGGQSDPMSVPQLESVTNLRRTRIELMLKQLAVDDVVERVTDGWRATGKDWTYDQAHYDGVVAARRREADIMRDYVQGRACLMRLLVESLDDPDPADCGKCSVCRGQLTNDLVSTTDPGQLRTITTALRRDAMILEPRKMWPGGTFGQRGRISPDAKAEVGRVLIHADAPEWSEVLRAAQNGDVAAVSELGDAAVATLASWVRAAEIRPDSIVSLRLTGTDLAEAVASHLRSVGRRPGTVLPVQAGRTPDSGATGAVEAAYWRDHIDAPDPSSGTVAGQVVLMVADASSSGWPLTIAAAKLREAGASAVMPLLIHRTV